MPFYNDSHKKRASWDIREMQGCDKAEAIEEAYKRNHSQTETCRERAETEWVPKGPEELSKKL